MEIKMDDIEQFQKHFVTPLVEAVRAEVQNSITPVIRDVAALKERADGSDKRVNKLESDQKHAMIGYGVFSAGLAAALAAAWNWIKVHIKIG